MNSHKSFLASKGILGAITTIAGAAAPLILARAGLANDADQQALIASGSQVVTAAGGFLALFGRITATKRIG